jgi:hypothetical protein
MLFVDTRHFCHMRLLVEMHFADCEMRLVPGLTAVLRSCYVEIGSRAPDQGDAILIQRMKRMMAKWNQFGWFVKLSMYRPSEHLVEAKRRPLPRPHLYRPKEAIHYMCTPHLTHIHCEQPGTWLR